MKTLAILQARMNSTRLPGKVLKPILGKPMLLHQIERLKKSTLIDDIMVATTIHDSDQDVVDLCRCNNIKFFRGDVDDVLDRFFRAVQDYGPVDVIVRVTADCPLIDWEIADKVIDYFIENDFDYCSNNQTPTFPDGLDVEVFKYQTLKTAHEKAQKLYEREHVTPYIYMNDDKFNIGLFKNNTDYSHMRWTVDEPEDFSFVVNIYSALYPQNTDFNFSDILAYLKKHPELENLNSHFIRNESFEKQKREEI